MCRDLVVWCRRTIGRARRTHSFTFHIVEQPCIAPFSESHRPDAPSSGSVVVEVGKLGGRGTSVTGTAVAYGILLPITA